MFPNVKIRLSVTVTVLFNRLLTCTLLELLISMRAMVRLGGRISVPVPLKTILPFTVNVPPMLCTAAPPVFSIAFAVMFKLRLLRLPVNVGLVNANVPYCIEREPLAVKLRDAPEATVTTLSGFHGTAGTFCLSIISLLSVSPDPVIACAEVVLSPPPRFRVVGFAINACVTPFPLTSPSTNRVLLDKSTVPCTILNLP